MDPTQIRRKLLALMILRWILSKSVANCYSSKDFVMDPTQIRRKLLALMIL